MSQELPPTPPLEEMVCGMIREYYQCNPAGGHLHVAIDDGNLDDESILRCINMAAKQDAWLSVVVGRALYMLPLETRNTLWENRWKPVTQAHNTRSLHEDAPE